MAHGEIPPCRPVDRRVTWPSDVATRASNLCLEHGHASGEPRFDRRVPPGGPLALGRLPFCGRPLQLRFHLGGLFLRALGSELALLDASLLLLVPLTSETFKLSGLPERVCFQWKTDESDQLR